MKWWRRKPARPVDTDPELARIRRELIRKFGEEIAYAIRLTGRDEPLVGRPTWEPLPTHEAPQQVEGILAAHPHQGGDSTCCERSMTRLHARQRTLTNPR
ncbi:hypothetical protein [Streptosporangium roseum]|uniref:hypothetical protein n=1 Tax=Streptosporangium roseum TaxID=2001 RepID=UPI0011D2AB03|nr:hypothetical protein [Streptosporangium roseum]